MVDQVSLFDADMQSGKTSWVPFQATKAATSKRSSRSSSGLQSRKLPMCLCLRMESGPSQDGSTMNWVDGAWPGESTMLSSGAFRSDANGLLWLRTSTDSQPQRYYLTLNIGEKPREPNPTKLSQILETEADPKYRLSAKACQGILNRAERRGKELPRELKEALEEQIGEAEVAEPVAQSQTEGLGKSVVPSVSKNGPENLGGARESLSRVSGQEPCQRLTTNQCCSVDVYNQTVERDEISGTVTAEVGVPNHSGPKVMEMIPIEGNGQRESHCGDG